MAALATNERPGTRAQLRFARTSAYKARAVLDLIRGLPVDRADELLEFGQRDVAKPIRKLLASAIANAVHNDEQDGDSLYISACYADEGPTLKRWRPRARGRAARIRRRTCHITIIVSPMTPEMVARAEAQSAAGAGATRGRRQQEARRARVARSRAAQAEAEPGEPDEAEPEEPEPDEAELEEPELDEAELEEAEPQEAELEEAAEPDEPEPEEAELDEPETDEEPDDETEGSTQAKASEEGEEKQ